MCRMGRGGCVGWVGTVGMGRGGCAGWVWVGV